MKKLVSILLTAVLILSMSAGAVFTVGAETATSDTWDGTANIQWYLDGPNADGYYELNTAEDLAGLAYIVGAANAEGRYNGVWYSDGGVVVGYRGGPESAYQEAGMVVKATATVGLTAVDGNSFMGKTVLLNVDVVLNEGNAADWVNGAPASVKKWQPIGGNIDDDADNWAGFDGTFDGQNHTVSGLYYSRHDVSLGGLFGFVGQGLPATVKNLKLTNFYTCGSITGALIGRNGKLVTVENVHISNGTVATPADSSSAGVFLGAMFGGAGVFRYSSVDNVKVEGYKYLAIFAGLMVGQQIDITDCYVKNSSVKGEAQVGIIVGRAAGGSLNVKNMYAIIDLTATGTDTEDTGAKMAGAGLIYGVAGDNNKMALKSITGFYHDSAVEGAVINEEMVDKTTATEVDEIKGEFAKLTMPGFDYDEIWKTVEGDTPVIELRGSMLDQGSDDDNNDDFLTGDDEEEEGGVSVNKPNSSDNSSNKNDSTNQKDNTATTDASADTADDKKGCGSVVGFAGLALMAVLSGAAVMLKKED